MERRNGEEALVSPGKKIDYTNAGELKEKALSLFEDGYGLIKIDFKEVETIDSSGLGKLLLLYKKLKERDDELRLINVNNEYIRKMFEMIHLYKVIPIEGMDKHGENTGS
ncbi:MAG: STAS domain-containing protein [Halanaerobiaceae bacterium]